MAAVSINLSKLQNRLPTRHEWPRLTPLWLVSQFECEVAFQTSPTRKRGLHSTVAGAPARASR